MRRSQRVEASAIDRNGTKDGIPAPSEQSGASNKRSRERSHSPLDDNTMSTNMVKQNSDEEKASWKGWAELENDPAIFTTLLREWGVPSVQVNEVVPLESILDAKADEVYGLIFLSRWTAADAENEATEVSTNVWFANQTSTYSCATLAIMNIINNRPDLDLGTHLNEFRTSTIALSSKDRGLALDHFDHVRDVHNSFATRFDKMSVDLRLKRDATAYTRKKQASRAAMKPKKGRKKRKKADLEDEEDDENGFHFIAYVPANGYIWRMDGMEALPRNIGSLEVGDNWLTAVISELQKQWESASANALEFSLLSLTARTDTSSREREELEMQKAREDWGPFIAHLVQLHAERGDLKDRLA